MKHKKAFGSMMMLAVFSQMGFAQGSEIEWKADKAIALGSHCNSIENNGREIDTYFLSNGDDVSVVWSGLQFNLTGHGDELAARQNCSIRIPISTTRGWYIGEIEQHLSHYLLKSRGARVSIATRATVANAAVSPFTISYPSATAFRGIYDNSRIDLLTEQAAYVHSWCRNPSGIYKFNVAISAMRDSHQAVVIAGVEEDIRLDLSLRSSLCPGSNDAVIR